MVMLLDNSPDAKSALVVIETLRAAERELSHMAQGNTLSAYVQIADNIAGIVREKIDAIVRDYRKLAVEMHNCAGTINITKGTSDNNNKWGACHYYGEKALVNIALYYAAETTDDALVALTAVERALKDASKNHSDHLDAELVSNLQIMKPVTV